MNVDLTNPNRLDISSIVCWKIDELANLVYSEFGPSAFLLASSQAGH